MPDSFLTAAWRDLILFNWRVDSALLAPHVPAGTELDPREDEHWVSLVGFRFLDLAVKGVPAIGHRNFPEINLRFYVRREVKGELRRGVVFLRELTPRRLVEWVARAVYNEPYETLPLRALVEGRRTGYELELDGARQQMAVDAAGDWRGPEAMEEFFIEHYWGYNRQTDGGSMEYEVTHPTWKVRSVELARFDLDVLAIYGPEWAEALAGEPDSVMNADGSKVAVFSGTMI
ncbi:MAG: DUF2071 domain-containing protein [Verrucomicrobia subdivision 3 bacterium]|nr:DUF2071 domain-containing protein [Limisphaerales bacterium]